MPGERGSTKTSHSGSICSLRIGLKGPTSVPSTMLFIRTMNSLVSKRRRPTCISELEPKRIGLLHQLVPGIPLIGVLWTRGIRAVARHLQEIEDAAQTIGQRLFIAQAGNDAELNAAFVSLAQQRLGALLVAASTYLDTRRSQIIAFAAENRLPAIYQFREYVVSGGLISYGPRITDSYQLAGNYAARILQGTNPAELPVQQPTRFELVINRKTAKALGLTVPNSLQSLADELIE